MLILERFEGDTAIIENGDDRLEVEKKLVSSDAKEGDVLKLENGRYFPDKEETNKRREKITKLQNSLWS